MYQLSSLLGCDVSKANQRKGLFSIWKEVLATASQLVNFCLESVA